MATQRTFSEFMSICEAVSQSDLRLARSGVLSRHADALQREIDDVTSGKKPTTPKVKRKVAKISFIDRSNAKLREESEIDEKFSMAADTSKPQSPKPTKLPRSRERNVGRHDDWKDNPSTEWGKRPKAGQKLRSRASAVVGTQQRQDVETGVRNEEALGEVLMVTPPTGKTKKKVNKIEKPDPSHPDYVRLYREYIKSKQRQEAIDYVGMSSGAAEANKRKEAYNKAKRERQQSEAEAARREFRTKGVPFSDKKGSGHIVNGKKVYDS